MIRALIAVILLLAGVVVWQRATVATAKHSAETANATAEAARTLWMEAERTLKAERTQRAATQAAADSADNRQEKINADYQNRVAAAVAGRDSELGRLRRLWGSCETQRLSDGAAAAAEVAEEDRLRRASAAGIVRAVELAQSERDEAIDRYQALGAPAEIVGKP